MIGDFRQSIYSFRGSNPELFMNFKKYYPNAKVINLTTNYRSTKNIVESANRFIKQYYGDYEFYEDSISSNQDLGDIQVFSHSSKCSEAEKIAIEIEKNLKSGTKPNEIVVLYRLNQNSFNLENELKRRNIQYFIHSNDRNFFNRKEINCIMCMLRLIINPHDNIAYDTVFNTRMHPFTFMPNIIKDRIYDLAASKNISYFEASDVVKVDKSQQKDNLHTFNKNISTLILQHKKGIKLTTLVDNILVFLRMNDFINSKYEGEEIDERLESISAFKSFLRDNTVESFLKFVYSDSKSDKKCSEDDIQLMTIHKSKGLEFKNVYLIGIEENKFPNQKAPLDEESRLFYVAVTRAKQNLYLSEIGYNNRFVGEYTFKVS
jgi:DNA helicase-2/ATP-dependent DNA helicase PcrA